MREAYPAGYAGTDILGTGYDLEIIVHAGAGAYICGEETALLDSLEGRRGQPRLRPPFPAIAGLYASPTVINNVESIASVPSVINGGPDWFGSMGTEKSKGMTIYSLSGHVANPGQFEAPLGITLRQLLELAGGIRTGHELKFWTPGGSSTPTLTAEHQDVPLDYEGMTSVKSMLGTRRRSASTRRRRWCGRCCAGPSLQARVLWEAHPVREGTWWLVQILKRMEAGQGQEGDIESCSTCARTSWVARSARSGTGPCPDLLCHRILPRRVRGGHHTRPGAVPVRAEHDLRSRAGGGCRTVAFAPLPSLRHL